MKIGIDIDGVLTNIERFQIDYGTKYAYENNISVDIDISKYYSTDCFGFDEYNDNRFWNQYIFEYAENYEMRSFANEVIDKLKKDGNEIYIITARAYTYKDTAEGERMRAVVKNWLKKNNIYYDKIFFSSEDKSKYCKENNIDVMIEDSPMNIAVLSSVVDKIICFDASYNKECKGENIIRCYSWYDIYNKIKSMN